MDHRRRRVLQAMGGGAALATLGSAGGLPVEVAASPKVLDPGLALRACRISRGPCRGAFRLAPGGRIVWYFSNLALLPFARHGHTGWRQPIRDYLELYLSRMVADYTILDVLQPVDDLGHAAPDSHDAYASTLIALACAYGSGFDERSWLRARLPVLKDIAYANLARPQRASGLVSTFQDGSGAGFLKDNCENWHGLHALRAALTGARDPDASYFATVAQGVLAGITGLYDVPGGAWRAADAPTAPGFYPDLVCQVYAEAWNVPVSQVSKDAGYARLNLLAPQWPQGIYDPYPWMVLGVVAAARGNRARAQAQRAMCSALYSTDPTRLTCNELGWVLSLDAALA